MASIRQQIRDERNRPAPPPVTDPCPPLQQERDVPPCGPLDDSDPGDEHVETPGNIITNLFRSNRREEL